MKRIVAARRACQSLSTSSSLALSSDGRKESGWTAFAHARAWTDVAEQRRSIQERGCRGKSRLRVHAPRCVGVGEARAHDVHAGALRYRKVTR